MDSHASLVGRTLGHYRLEEEIGAGGMGVVYRARDERLDRDVAVKVLPTGLLAEPAARRRFRQEALALSRLNHPHVETVFDFHTEDGLDYLVIEYIPGMTLRSLLAAGPLVESEVLRLGAQASEGLAAAHAQGVVHRDIKADNLRVTPEGRLKILDFGLASVTRPPGETELTRSVTAVQTVSGTLPYMAPEQLEGQPGDARSDVYALGVVLYEMATGRRPFEASVPTALVGDILRKAPVPPRDVNPTLSPELNATILKCLEKDATRRYASAGELLADVQRLRTASAVTAVAAPVRQPTRAPWRRFWVLVPVGLVVIAVGVALFWPLWTPAPVLGAGDRLLLAHFTAQGNEAALAAALRTAVATKLTDSPFLSLVSDAEIAETLPLMRKPATEPVVGAVARDVCRRVGGRALLAGDVARPGDSFVVDLHVVGCETGADLAVSQAQGNTYAALTGDLDVKLRALRQRLGEALASIEQHDAPLERVTTGNVEALKAYSEGERIRLGTGSNNDSIPYYQRAIELDPDFAIAHRALGAVYSNVGMFKESRVHRQRAYELRERLTERERLMVDVQYHLFVEYDFSRVREALNQFRTAYPNDAWGHYQEGQLCRITGDQDKALDAFRQAARVDPRATVFKNAVAGGLFTVGRLDEALAYSPDSEVAFLVAFLRDDPAGMANAVRKRSGQLPVQAQAMAAASRGQLAVARERFREAAATLPVGAARDVQAIAAWWEAEVGNPARARELATPLALNAAQTWLTLRDVTWLARLEETLGRMADVARNPAFALVGLPRVRAAVAVRQGRLAQALELLQVPAPYQYGTTLVSPTVRAPFLHENSLGVFHQRGQTYLALKDGAKAAADFQQILDHPGLGPLTPAYALAPLNLGRAYALAGDPARAKAAYERFFTRWRDADPDVPVLVEAKKELARLR